MTTALGALDLPLQLLALGSAAGMTSALFRHRRTGATDHWPIHLAIGSLSLFWAGVLLTVLDALT